MYPQAELSDLAARKVVLHIRTAQERARLWSVPLVFAPSLRWLNGVQGGLCWARRFWRLARWLAPRP